MAVATSDGRMRKGHDEKAVAANRERDVIAVAEHDDAGHGAELEGGVRTVLENEGGVRGIVLDGGVVAVKVVCGGEGGSLLHAQFLLVLVVGADWMWLWGARRRYSEKERKVRWFSRKTISS